LPTVLSNPCDLHYSWDNQIVPFGFFDLIKIMNKDTKTDVNSMIISKERLSQFTRFIEYKTGKKLSEAEALEQAQTLLRTMIILYRPITQKEYYSAIAKKMFIRSQSKKINRTNKK
jgi:hypothetical protein